MQEQVPLKRNIVPGNLSLPFPELPSALPLRRRNSKAPIDLSGLETVLLNQARAEDLLKLVDETKPYFDENSQERLSARDTLEIFLARGDRERFKFEMDITPALALEMLKLNHMNRPLVIPRIRELITVMVEGKWQLTHQGGAIAKNRILNDGQKRLWACAISGVPIKMEMTFGVERDEFKATDLGQRRSNGDALYVSGRRHHNLRAAAVALLYRWKDGQKLGQGDVLEIEATMDQDILDAACEAGSRCRNVMNRTACAAGYYKIATSSRTPSRLTEFMDFLNSGAIPDKSDPILKFRETIRGRNSNNSRSSVFQEAAMMIVTWNAWIQRRRPRSISWQSNTDFPEVE